MSINIKEPKKVLSIVCSVTGTPADLFIRNDQSRLVPLSRSIFEILSKRKNELIPLLHQAGKGNMVQFLESSNINELDFQEHEQEYWNQTPTDKENRRRKFFNIYTDIIKIVWSKTTKIDEASLRPYVPSEENFDDCVITNIVGKPTQDMNISIIGKRKFKDEEIDFILEQSFSDDS